MSELAVQEGPDGSNGKSLEKLRNFQPQEHSPLTLESFCWEAVKVRAGKVSGSSI